MPVSRIDQLLLAAGALLVVILGGIGWLLLTGASPTPEPDAADLVIDGLPPASDGASATTAAAGILVVDVQGAVLRPGVYELPAGSRVGDAIAAAGGYDATVDTDAAAQALNLAAPLTDAQKVLVPRTAPAGADTVAGEAGDVDAGGGLVNLNTATAAELEELPGIGEVTADRIIAAREEQPFTSLEELVERDVMNRGQLDDIRDLATVD